MITVGIDEVGRGCWAGPVVAGAVALSDIITSADKSLSGLRDSKLTSLSERQHLSRLIYQFASQVGLGWVEAAVVDEIGLTAAVALAMQRALDAMTLPYDRIIIDGNYNFLPDNHKVAAVIKADNTVPAVSAASIVAKVARDDYMSTVAAAQYPAYGFEKHVGYGTKLHRQMLEMHGVTLLHRRSYKPIQKILVQSSHA